MKYQYRLVLLLKTFISIALIALLLLPYAVTLHFTGIEDYAEWGYLYLWEDELLIFMYVPFYILWPWYLLQKKKWQIVILLLLSFFYLGSGLGNLAIPLQDFMPSAGILLAASLFPSTLFLYFFTRKKKIAVAQQ